MFDFASYRHSGGHGPVSATAALRLYRDGRPLPPSEAEAVSGARLLPGDALLLCSEELLEFLFDEEICVDLLKSADAQAWLNYLLVRLADKTRLAIDDFSLACGIWL